VQTQNGDWWIVFLATRPYAGYHNYLGRETFLAPVDWSSDWPALKDGSYEVKVSYPRPCLPFGPIKKEPVRDDFDQPTLGFAWNFLRTPRETWWGLTERPGFLRLKLRPPRLHEMANPSYIGRRVQDREFTSSAKVEFNPQAGNEEAGIALYKSSKAFFRLIVHQRDGKRHVSLIKRLIQDDRDSEVACAVIPSGVVYLRIDTHNRRYRFSLSANSKKWRVLDNTFDVSCLAQVVCGGFTGIYVGMFAGSNGQPSTNHANFDWFEYRPATT
jgi:alpha-N-arabinofuranosidase